MPLSASAQGMAVAAPCFLAAPRSCPICPCVCAVFWFVTASNAKGAGSSEVSSCNYPARAKGLKAGMFMMKAKELCPELVVLR